jgi:hypothetical protein
LCDWLTELAEQVIPQRDKPSLPNRRKSLQKSAKKKFDSSPAPRSETKKNYVLLACFPERLFGLLGISILFRPTPIAPELTRTTL